MPTQKIRQFLLEHKTFQLQMDEVIRLGVANEFPSIQISATGAKLNWQYLLLCASALARSDDGEAQRVALRIADTCLKLPGSEMSRKVAAAVILDIMANERAENLAIGRELISSEWAYSLPLPLQGDQLKRHTEDVIVTSDGLTFPVNRFQRDFWMALKSANQVSASAPTSAGKSFMLRLWTAEKFREKPNARVVVLVPTRALIQEYADEFGRDVEAGTLKSVSVHTLPLDESFAGEGGHLCVFTQERLHILLGRAPFAEFDLIVVDEAQKVGDGYRGVLLEQVLNESQKRSASVQVVYASPFSDNPEYLMRNTASHVPTKPVDREVTTVTQNLLFLSQKRGDSLTWKVSFENDTRSLPLGIVTLPFRPVPASKRLTMVALVMGRGNSGNLVYANGAADAEKYAHQISDGLAQLEPDRKAVDPRVAELIKLVQKTVHKKYLLATTLKLGVAYHYGNMPLLIRTEIETLFRENVLRYLVCTGTLIEGVNLPCKVIFLRGPKKGKKHPMLPVDFWNLAGRAGRWGKEFHGTIVCVDSSDPKVWKEPPPKKRVRQKIASSMEDCLVRSRDLINYIQAGYPVEVSDREPDFDYTLSYLLHLLVRDGTINEASKGYADTEDGMELLELLAAELKSFKLPQEFIFRHPGILPAAMQVLLERLASMSDEELVALAPTQPEAADAVETYLSILKFINNELRARWAQGAFFENRLKQLAYLTVEWMVGNPLAMLIKRRERIEAWRQTQGKAGKELPALIIQVMKDVEEYARFKVPKYLKAFLDVLYFHASSRGLDGKMMVLPDLELWMELGVSTRTQLALMEIGLSRTSAIELMEFIMNPDLSRDAVIKWLLDANIEGFDLPGPVRKEIRKVVVRYDKLNADAA